MYFVNVTPLTRLPRSVEQVFTYHHETKIDEHKLVMVNFHGRRLIAVVTKSDVPKPKFKTLPIIKELPYQLTPQQVYLSRLLVEFYASSDSLALSTIIPNLRRNIPTENIPKNTRNHINKEEPKLMSTIWGEIPNPTSPVIEKLISENNTGQTLILVPDQISLEASIEKYPSAVVWNTSNSSRATNSWNKAQIAKLIIGTKNALFAPIPNISQIIVIDSSSELYRSRDAQPKYNSIVLIKELAKKFKIKVTQIQTLPTLQESTGTYLAQKVEVNKIPTILNRKSYGYADKHESLGSEILDKIKNENGRVLIYANKRGYAALHCTECETTIRCPHCELPVSGDSANSTEARCRKCRTQFPLPSACPNCHQQTLKHVGHGIRRLKDYVKMHFPDRPVCQIDADKTVDPASFLQLINTLPADSILLCTAAILPRIWLLPDISLAIIPRADQHLTIPNWRANEFFLQTVYTLMCKASTELIIELSETEYPVINALKNGNLKFFWEQERLSRQNQGYPPYGHIVHISNSTRVNEFKNKPDVVNEVISLNNTEFILKLKHLNSGLWVNLEDSAKVDVDPYSIV